MDSVMPVLAAISAEILSRPSVAVTLASLNKYLKCVFRWVQFIWKGPFSRVPMRLTAFTDFALRTLMRLAGEPTRSFATNEIAAEFGISRNHLAKVVRDLADSGFISTQRGAGGGFTLARPAQSITLGEVVRALEARQALVECFRGDGGACVLTPRCRLKMRL